MPDTLQVTLVGALGGRPELQRAAEVQRDLRQLVGAGDEHEAPDRVRVLHRRAALGDEQRDEAAERMRDDGVDLAEVVAHGEHRAGAVGEVGAPAGAQPVGGKVEGDDAIARAPQRLHERGHEGGFARPAVHQHDGAARLAVGLEDVGLHVAGRRRQALPLGVAQMEAGTRGELVMIVRAVLRQLRRAEDAEGDIARQRRRQRVEHGCSAGMRATQRQRALLLSVSYSRRTRSADVRGSKFPGNRPRWAAPTATSDG